ncbi:MAG: NTP transferase domain-containing protein [Bacteroidetes bacterium]|nr:NTP transferase domain-containing protein [Bacteroidota bacterium]
MKAIIPVAGAGTNLRPLTYTQPKPLIPVAGKPIISFIIDQLTDCGIRDFVFVIGYLGEKIRHFVEEAYPDLKKTFVNQEVREGSGHAIWTAREEIRGTDEIVIFFGDTIVDLDFDAFLNTPESCIAVQEVPEPGQFGVVEIDASGQVIRAEEKPKIPMSNLAMVGFYKINKPDVLLDALDHNIRNNIRNDGEFPLTDGLMGMVERGNPLSVLRVDRWFDCGQKEVLLETNALLLDKAGYASTDLPTYENTIIIHPVTIGADCVIKNSIIGPHVTIGACATIESAIIKNSIIGNYAGLKEVVLESSVIGNDTSITGLGQRLNIGDNTEIDFR